MTFSEQLLRLAQWMAGHFNNAEQARREPVWFANIHVFQCPLSVDLLGGFSFYVEQAYDIALQQPYRQRVVSLQEDTTGIRIQNYGLRNSQAFAGAGQDRRRLRQLTSADLEILPGCITEVQWTGASYKGKSIPGKTCIVVRREQQTYLRAEFELTDARFWSLDQGLDPETDQVIWGSLSGPFQFVKLASFASELSPASL
ncbi:MAG: chorismate mutase [Synechococcaceae cyanobacterium SM2_3_1]|nr:chorismate mutase [Synechococcaceae cyanobacterium SM2_3_1]